MKLHKKHVFCKIPWSFRIKCLTLRRVFSSSVNNSKKCKEARMPRGNRDAASECESLLRFA